MKCWVQSYIVWDIILLTVHPTQDIFSWVPNYSLEPLRCETNLSSKINLFGLCVNTYFPWQPIVDLRMGFAYKITHISAVTQLRLLN